MPLRRPVSYKVKWSTEEQQVRSSSSLHIQVHTCAHAFTTACASACTHTHMHLKIIRIDLLFSLLWKWHSCGLHCKFTSYYSDYIQKRKPHRQWWNCAEWVKESQARKRCDYTNVHNFVRIQPILPGGMSLLGRLQKHDSKKKKCICSKGKGILRPKL